MRQGGSTAWSIPGCESIDRVSDNEYKVAMTAAIGPVKAKFSGKLLLADMNPPHSYSLAFEGSGGAAGFGKGSAQVSLVPEGSGTLLTYKATANVGGKLAQIGSRLIDGVAKKMSDDFFARFNKTVAPAVAAPPTAQPPKTAVPVWVWIGMAFFQAVLIVNALQVGRKSRLTLGAA